MVIRKISPANLNRLRSSLGEVLLDNGVAYLTIGLTEKEEKLAFIFETKDKAHVLEWEKKYVIGRDTVDIANDILGPVIKELKQRMA